VSLYWRFWCLPFGYRIIYTTMVGIKQELYNFESKANYPRESRSEWIEALRE
jgi:hypothetical protein